MGEENSTTSKSSKFHTLIKFNIIIMQIWKSGGCSQACVIFYTTEVVICEILMKLSGVHHSTWLINPQFHKHSDTVNLIE